MVVVCDVECMAVVKCGVNNSVVVCIMWLFVCKVG